MMPLLLG